MDKIKAIVSQHKKASLLALFALIVFVGFSVTSAMNVAQRRAEGESIGQVEQSNDKSPSSESSKDIRLSDSQKEAIKGYDDKVKRLIETMSSSIWSDKSGTNTLRFYDTYYVETIKRCYRWCIHPLPDVDSRHWNSWSRLSISSGTSGVPCHYIPSHLRPRKVRFLGKGDSG